MLKKEIEANFQILSKLNVLDGLVMKETYPSQSHQHLMTNLLILMLKLGIYPKQSLINMFISSFTNTHL